MASAIWNDGPISRAWQAYSGRRVEIQTGSCIRWAGQAYGDRPFPYPDRRKLLQSDFSTFQLAVSIFKASYRDSR